MKSNGKFSSNTMVIAKTMNRKHEMIFADPRGIGLTWLDYAFETRDRVAFRQ